MTDTITKTIFFNAPRETVWAFLTDKDKLATWFHPAEKDLAEGDDYCLYRPADDGAHMPQVWGRVLKMEPPALLVSTFIVKPFGDNETTLTWQLDEMAGGTRLTLTHEGIAAATGADAGRILALLDKGWDAHFASFRDAIAG